AAAARAIREALPQEVARAVGTVRVIARGVVVWDNSDVAWWRALDTALAQRGGSAVVELGVFEARLDSSRERGPLEMVADDLARALDNAPLLVPIAAPLGDLRLEGDTLAGAKNVEVRRAANAEAQAGAAVDAVHAALAAGTPIDRIGVALPRVE